MVLFCNFEAVFTTVFYKTVFSLLTYPGITITPVMFLLFACRYVHVDKWIKKKNVVLLFIIPAATVALAATNSIHGLLCPEVTVAIISYDFIALSVEVLKEAGAVSPDFNSWKDNEDEDAIVSGAILIRQRWNGHEFDPVKVVKSSNDGIIPSKTKNPEWWTAKHEIEIKVVNIDDAETANNRMVQVYIDGKHVLDFDYESKAPVQDVKHYTGFRAWIGRLI